MNQHSGISAGWVNTEHNGFCSFCTRETKRVLEVFPRGIKQAGSENIDDQGELLPCPFCGETARIKMTHRLHYVAVCNNDECGCELRLPQIGETGIQRAIESWNTREVPSVEPKGSKSDSASYSPKTIRFCTPCWRELKALAR